MTNSYIKYKNFCIATENFSQEYFGIFVLLYIYFHISQELYNNNK